MRRREGSRRGRAVLAALLQGELPKQSGGSSRVQTARSMSSFFTGSRLELGMSCTRGAVRWLENDDG